MCRPLSRYSPLLSVTWACVSSPVKIFPTALSYLGLCVVPCQDIPHCSQLPGPVCRPLSRYSPLLSVTWACVSSPVKIFPTALSAGMMTSLSVTSRRWASLRHTPLSMTLWIFSLGPSATQKQDANNTAIQGGMGSEIKKGVAIWSLSGGYPRAPPPPLPYKLPRRLLTQLLQCY